MKALIIDEPWIGLILRSKKTWEMRKTACHQRGQIALIRKGSGQVVGVAEIAGSLPPLENPDSYQAAEPRHCIPPSRQAQAFGDGWCTPWVIENAQPLARPVADAHQSGAIIWVDLDPVVAAAMATQLGRHKVAAPPIRSVVQVTVEPKAPVPTDAQPMVCVSASPAGTTRDVTVTGGNLRNDHIYLPLDFFPADAIGGSNKSKTASRTITVIFRPGGTVQTDIDGTKRILQARAHVGNFLARSGVQEGDAVRINRTSPYVHEFSRVTNA